jgi:hypothetical protein
MRYVWNITSQQLLLRSYLGIIASEGIHYILMVQAGVFSKSMSGFDICDQSIRHSGQRRRQAFIYLKGSDSGLSLNIYLGSLSSNSSYA